MAKYLNKDVQTYQREYDSFMKDLQQFHANRGSRLNKIPSIGGKDVDLYLLYTKVTAMGGWNKVNDYFRWEEIQELFHIPQACTNAAQALKQIYIRYLDTYEKVHFHGEDANQQELEDAETATIHRRSRTPVRLNYNYRQHEVPDQMRSSLGMSTDFVETGDYDKVEKSLLSGLPNEVDFAVNVCTLLSNESRHIMKLDKGQRIIRLLMAHIGIFEDGAASLRQVYEKSWKPATGRNFIKFWYDSVTDKDIKDLITLNKEQAERDKQNEHSFVGGEVLNMGRELGVHDVEGQRVLQIAVIMRNLSFEKVNAAVLASDLLVFRFLLLCVYSRYSCLKQMALDTLGNIASKLVLEPIDFRSTQLVFRTICRCITSVDKFEMVRGMEILAKLCQVDENEDVITENLDPEIYKHIVSMLTVSDIQLIVHTLEVLYELSELGEVSSTHISDVRSSVEILVDLLTIEAQMYGPGALVGIKVVEHTEEVSFPQSPAIESSHTTPNKPPQIVQRPAPVLQQAPTPQPQVQPQPPKPRMEIEPFTCNWLQAYYEYRNNSTVTRMDLYADYCACFKKLGQTNLLPPMHFINSVKVVFPKSNVMRKEMQDGSSEFCFIGLGRKMVPLPFPPPNAFPKPPPPYPANGTPRIMTPNKMAPPTLPQAQFQNRPNFAQVQGANFRPQGHLQGQPIPGTRSFDMRAQPGPTQPGSSKPQSVLQQQLNSPSLTQQSNWNQPQAQSSPSFPSMPTVVPKRNQPHPPPCPTPPSPIGSSSTPTSPQLSRTPTPPMGSPVRPPSRDSNLIKSLLANKVNRKMAERQANSGSPFLDQSNAQQPQDFQQNQFHYHQFPGTNPGQPQGMNPGAHYHQGYGQQQNQYMYNQQGQFQAHSQGSNNFQTGFPTPYNNQQMEPPKSSKAKRKNSSSRAGSPRTTSPARAGSPKGKSPSRKNSPVRSGSPRPKSPKNPDFEMQVESTLEVCAQVERAQDVVIHSDLVVEAKIERVENQHAKMLEEQKLSMEMIENRTNEHRSESRSRNDEYLPNKLPNGPSSVKSLESVPHQLPNGPISISEQSISTPIEKQNLSDVNKKTVDEKHSGVNADSPLNNKSASETKYEVSDINVESKNEKIESPNGLDIDQSQISKPVSNGALSSPSTSEPSLPPKPLVNGLPEGDLSELTEKADKKRELIEKMISTEHIQVNGVVNHLGNGDCLLEKERIAEQIESFKQKNDRLSIERTKVEGMRKDCGDEITSEESAIKFTNKTEKMNGHAKTDCDDSQSVTKAASETDILKPKNRETELTEKSKSDMSVNRTVQKDNHVNNEKSQGETCKIKIDENTAEKEVEKMEVEECNSAQKVNESETSSKPETAIENSAKETEQQLDKSESVKNKVSMGVSQDLDNASTKTETTTTLTSSTTTPKTKPAKTKNKRLSGEEDKIVKPKKRCRSSTGSTESRRSSTQSIASTQGSITPAPMPPINEYVCEWEGCMKNFDNAKQVFSHVCKTHVVPDGICLWENCDKMPRKKWALITHFQDRHCSEHALKASAMRRHQIALTGATPQQPPPPPAAHIYPQDAAWQAIKRFIPRRPFQEFLEPKEGPVTKHIRVTSALILRNLSRYSAHGRSVIKKYEHVLSFVAMSNVESSTAIANCLWEILNNHETIIHQD